MKIINSIHNFLSLSFSKPSKLDGRFLVGLVLLIYFSLIFLSSFFTNYYKFWDHAFGVPAMYPPFADMRVLTSGIDCTRAGYDVLVENPCDPWQRPTNYPRLWIILLEPLGLSQSHTMILGVIAALLFYFFVFKQMGRINYYEAFFYSLILCSPPVMLLVERGNTDAIIFLLLSVVLILCENHQFIYRITAYSLLVFSALLKLFPVFGLTLLFRERRKRFIVLIAFSLTFFLTYFWNDLEELNLIIKATPRTHFLSYGYKVIFEEIHANLVMRFLNVLCVELVLFLITVIIICLFIYHCYKNFRQWLSLPRSELKKTMLWFDSQSLDGFRLGAGIYLGTFLLGNNWDYRLSFLLFTIPQILKWTQEKNELGLLSSLGLVGIIASLYLSRNSWLALDEIANWFLFGYFVYSLLVSLPAWLKILGHTILAKPYKA
jgi:hypothetical protein